MKDNKKKKTKSFKDRCKSHRLRVLEISQKVPAIHIGGSFSCCEIIDTIYYNFIIKNNSKFILSKGHAAIMQYVILESLGIIKKKDLENYCSKKGSLGVHPEIFTSGIEASTGSLGHGLAIGAGMAIANPKKDIFVVISDGELMEGSIWESILFISSNKINNIKLIIDNNNLQSATRATDTHPSLYPIKEKLKSFGWDAKDCDGHNSKKLFKKLNIKTKKKPFALIAKTIKGHPISFMKNVPKWHYRSPNQEELKKAIEELK